MPSPPPSIITTTKASAATNSATSDKLGRDLVGELLSDDRCHAADQDARFESEKQVQMRSNNMLTFPPATDLNSDAKLNGCMRVIHRELSAETTDALLRICRRNKVSVQAVLTCVATLALLHLRHISGELDIDDWNAPVCHVAPVNMRRYLETTVNQPILERIPAMGSVTLWWEMAALRSYAELSGRLFWADFVTTGAHQPLQEALNSSYLHRSLMRGESGIQEHGQLRFSFVTTSVGNTVSLLKKEYRPCSSAVHSCVSSSSVGDPPPALSLLEVILQAGFYSTSQEQYDCPVVPPSSINSGTPGHAWVHAYTVFGRLKLACGYKTYKTDYIAQYYDEIVRLLVEVSADNGEMKGGLKVGDVFKLEMQKEKTPHDADMMMLLRNTLQSSATINGTMNNESDTSSHFEMRGVRLKLLRAIVKLAKQIGGDWTVGRISNVLNGAHEILQENHRWGADIDPAVTLTFADKMSLIDVLKTHHNDASNPHPTLGVCYDEVVGEQASIFCSFTYGSDFFELVESLEAFVLDNPEHTDDYFWFDTFVNNQWVALDRSFEWWASTFKTAVKKIGHLVLICLPWSDPEPLKRAWCLWEIFCAIESGSKFDVALGSDQQGTFIEAIVANGSEYYKMLGNINVENSQSWRPEDKENIFKAINESVGFAELNSMVSTKMRHWVISIIDRDILSHINLNASKQDLWSKFIAKSSLLIDRAEYDAAITLCQQCLLDFGDMEDAGRLAKTMNHMGNATRLQGNYAKALDFHEKALQKQLHCPYIGDKHSDVGDTYSSIGKAYHLLHDCENEMIAHQMSLKNLLHSLGSEHPKVAMCYKDIGNVYWCQKARDVDKAYEYLEKALLIEKNALGDYHSDVGYTYAYIGRVHQSEGDFTQALDYYEKTLRIHLKSLGPDHPRVAGIYGTMGTVYKMQQDYVKAIDFYHRELAINFKCLGPLHTRIGITNFNLGNLYKDLKNHVNAKVCYEKAHSIFLQSDKEGHLFTISAKKCLQIECCIIACMSSHPQPDHVMTFANHAALVEYDEDYSDEDCMCDCCMTPLASSLDTPIMHCSNCENDLCSKCMIPIA